MTNKTVREFAEVLGLAVNCSSPGDGSTRYEIGHRDPATGGFHDVYYTCGASKAYIYLRGYQDAIEHAKKIGGLK